MRLKVFASILALAFTLGAAAQTNPSADRPADREAIRAHIDSIFQAFIRKDRDALRATHHRNWLGYLEGSREMIKGVDGYMDYNYVDPSSPYGMKSYKMREFDMIFKGDAAFVCFTADVDAHTPNGPSSRVLRISDFYTKENGKWIQTGSDTALHPESEAEQQQMYRPITESARKQLLAAREAVWRAYFGNNRAALEMLIPEETIAINAGDNNWERRQQVLDGSANFARSGGKLVKLEFPRTEIQLFGYTAIVYSDYAYELEAA